MCNIHLRNPFITCLLPGWGPDDKCILHSDNPNKNKSEFERAFLEKNKKNDTDFRAVFFPDILNFTKYEFKDIVDFSYAEFNDKVYFQDTKFNKVAIFKNTKFNKDVDFAGAKFLEGGGAIFLDCEFNGKLLFNGTRIYQRTIFEKINYNVSESVIGNFKYIEFGENGILNFKDLSLAQVEFVGTNLNSCEFHNVVWNRCLARNALYDEVLIHWVFHLKNFILCLFRRKERQALPKPLIKTLSRIEELYRQLKIKCENEGDLKNVGDFYYGEMEMHRRASRWHIFPLYWYNLYWLSSGYGERPLRSVLILLGLLFAFSGFFCKLESQWLGDMSWTAFWQAFLYVFQQGTLQKPDGLKPATPGGKLLSAIMPVLIPGQAALFVLALRNRLGRRR
jgi:hypothetical protein